MKYLLFAGEDFYPEGGFDDFINTFDSIEDAKEFVDANRGEDYKWAHIVDSKSFKILICGDLIRKWSISYEVYQGFEWYLPDEQVNG